MWLNNEWNEKPPENDGYFYYEGETPNGENVVEIVQIVTNPKDGERWAFLFVPPVWRGDEKRRAILHSADLFEWKGRWSGPEHGYLTIILSNVTGELPKNGESE